MFYAYSNDLKALQVDAVYGEGDGEDNPNDDLGRVEFGLSVNVGGLGKVATAHADNKYSENRSLGSDDAVFTAACDTSNAAYTKAKAKTTFFGISGGLGDTGVSYVFQWNDKNETNKNPWVLSLTKGLGDGASVVL